MAFTIERYIVMCHPNLAPEVRSLKRTKRIIACLWIFTVFYCSPWLGLAEVQSLETDQLQYQCELRSLPTLIQSIFGADLVLFYLLPVIVAILVYSKMGMILCRGLQVSLAEEKKERRKILIIQEVQNGRTNAESAIGNGHLEIQNGHLAAALIQHESTKHHVIWTIRSRVQVTN